MTLADDPAAPSNRAADYEEKRLAALQRYEILDTPPNGAFDRITALAARLFSVPIAIVGLVDRDRVWFKSHHGLEVDQVDRGPGLCASAIVQSVVLTDAKLDTRSLANPLVAGEFGLRFYAGLPLRTADGYDLGMLCVSDREPRAVTAEEMAHLEDLAGIVMDQMELRLSARQAVADLADMVARKDAALGRAQTLAREIDHRVKNSLQLTAAMLHLQSRGLDNSDAAAALAAAASRVSAIARVHEQVSLGGHGKRADCKTYIERLCGVLSGMLRDAAGKQSGFMPSRPSGRATRSCRSG